MQNLAPLNSATFFCPECGIGENGNCPAPHVERELLTPGSRSRQYLFIALIALVGLAVLAYSQI